MRSVKFKLLGSGLILLLALASCGKPKDLEFRKISNIKFNLPASTVGADVVMYNPNNLSLQLKSVEIDILVNGKQVGRVDQTHEVMITRKSEFSLPVSVAVSLKDLGLVNAFAGLLGGKSYPVQFKGLLRVNFYGIQKKIMIDYTEQIKL
jgi:LEA14-like dessication related protein